MIPLFSGVTGNVLSIRPNRFILNIISILLLSATLSAAGPAWAVHKNGDIELDGNTVNDGAAVAGVDDWDDIYNGTDHALRSIFTTDIYDNDPTAFKGGVKDTQSLDQWSCVTQPVQSKSDIQHAYAATYTNNGDLFYYAGADRLSDLGDSNMGVWLFQGPVGCISNGSSTPFFGTHIDGDLLLVAEFDRGGRVEAVVVYRWSDPDRIPQNGDECLGGSKGDCSDEGLPAFIGENCNDALPGDKVCGRTNPTSSINAAWRAGIPKQGFYETGINLTSLVKGVGCFANAIIETRSSTSLTAQLKDFVVLDLSTCGTLTVEKETNGGNANFGFAINPSAGNPANFSLAGGESRFFGTVEPGTYNIAETGMPAGPAAPNGWNLSDISCNGGTAGSPNYINAGHGGGNLNVSIDLNDDVVCTFTNEFSSPSGSITLQKQCDSVSNSGQTFNFSLGGFGSSSTAACADGTEALACGQAITCLGLGAGNYTINETVPAGWTLTDVNCIGNATCGSNLATQASITLAAADNAVATFTNSQNASITICKSTLPASAPGSFDFTGDLGAFVLADGQCTTPAAVLPGAVYAVTEAIAADFMLDNINCSGANWSADVAGARTVSVTPQPGEAVSCTFTNIENPAYIQICKTTVTVPGDSTVFEFELSGPQAGLPVSTTLENGNCALGLGDPGEFALAPASGYEVSEVPVAGWDTQVSCVGSAGAEIPANIILSPGEMVVCTFTNTQRGRIIVAKQTDPMGVSEIFSFSGDVAGDISDGGKIELEVLPGQYLSTEAATADWQLDGISCDDNNSSGNGSTATFNVEAGEIVTCTFSNSYIGVADGFIVVSKQTNPDGDLQLFNFSGDVAGDIADDGAIAIQVAPGQYTSTETALAGWDLDDISCDDNNSSGSGSTATFNVEAGESVTCTFTNSKRGHVIVAKQTNPAGVSEIFSFTGDVAGDITDGGMIDVEVVAGQYVSTESATADWQLDSISCDDNNSSGNGATATFNVEAGETVTCMFSNSFVGEANGFIVVRKETDPEGDPQVFNFSGDVVGDIADDGAIAVQVAPGQYTSTEAALAGWDLVDITCDDNNSFGNGSTATFNVEAGESVTCTFSNSKRGLMIVQKQTDPADDPQTFEFTGDLTGTVADNGEIQLEVVAGRYTSTETALVGWDLDSISCDDNNSYGDDATAVFNIEAGETVTCVFNNSFASVADGFIVVRKQTTPPGAAQLFTFSGDVAGDIADSGLISVQVAPGQYTSTETATTDWQLDGISCDDSNSSGNGATATFNVEAGETVTCTFSNSYIGVNNGHIVVRKETTPPGAAQLFTFSGDVAGDMADNGSIAVEVAPGQYTSTETATTDWQLDGISCDDSNSSGNGSTATFNVEAGETVTCTFSNSYVGVADGFIVVRKETTPANDPQLFNFSGDVAGDIADNDAIAIKVVPGQYTSTEAATADWQLDGISCDDSNSSGNGATATFNVEAGETVTCTFNNSFTAVAAGNIVVRKQTDPAGVPQLFAFSGDAAGNIADNGSITVQVAPGQYTSTEAATAGWQLDSISCDDNNSSGNGATATFNVEAGETVTCTFSNSFISTTDGYIVVRKQTNPSGDAQVFNFSGDVAGNIAHNGAIAVKVVPGQYTSTETATDGWELDSIACDDNNSGGNGATATFNVEAGESVTCTFVNQRVYTAIGVNAFWALLLLALALLASGWYFRLNQSRNF